jgi:glycosyltransferase involved in cell wall biosynthesis
VDREVLPEYRRYLVSYRLCDQAKGLLRLWESTTNRLSERGTAGQGSSDGRATSSGPTDEGQPQSRLAPGWSTLARECQELPGPCAGAACVAGPTLTSHALTVDKRMNHNEKITTRTGMASWWGPGASHILAGRRPGSAATACDDVRVLVRLQLNSTDYGPSAAGRGSVLRRAAATCTSLLLGQGWMMLSTVIGRMLLPGNAKANVRRPCYQNGRRPSVSVVIPCYNYGRYLSGCVKSVLDQPDVQVDVLVIDDASSDGSADIARELASRDNRINSTCHTTNRGHIATYNEGLAQARGDYTVLLSADDLLTPGCLARATSLMDEHPSVGFTYGFSVDFTDAHHPPARTNASKWIIWQGHSWIAYMCRTGRNVLLSPEAVIRTSVLRKIGGFRADLPHSGDFEIWMRAATVSDVGYVGGADQAYYRIHEDNMHHSFDILADVSERLRSFDTIFSERSALLTDSNLMRNAAHRALAREALGHAISAYARGVADREPVDDYAAFALTAWPDARNLSEWQTLSRLRKISDSRRGRNPLLTTREAMRNLTYSLRWWRRRWAGV